MKENIVTGRKVTETNPIHNISPNQNNFWTHHKKMEMKLSFTKAQ